MKPSITECKDEQIASGNRTSDNILSVQDGLCDNVMVAYESDSIELNKLQSFIGSKQHELSFTALRVLLRKRDQLVLFLSSNVLMVVRKNCRNSDLIILFQ
jgi:ABC-type dipeptide/oligopeptide/nickel transport system ATPase component